MKKITKFQPVSSVFSLTIGLVTLVISNIIMHYLKLMKMPQLIYLIFSFIYVVISFSGLLLIITSSYMLVRNFRRKEDKIKTYEPPTLSYTKDKRIIEKEFNKNWTHFQEFPLKERRKIFDIARNRYTPTKILKIMSKTDDPLLQSYLFRNRNSPLAYKVKFCMIIIIRALKGIFALITDKEVREGFVYLWRDKTAIEKLEVFNNTLSESEKDAVIDFIENLDDKELNKFKSMKSVDLIKFAKLGLPLKALLRLRKEELNNIKSLSYLELRALLEEKT